MRRIAQISDLHFGAHDPATVAALHEALTTAVPDLVVISGDLTQRARRWQFHAADAFLRGLEAAGMPLLVVPGNHDVPLYDVPRRLLAPLGRYCRIIARDRSLFFHDTEIAVLGLFSAHGLTIKDGRLTGAQIARIGRTFAQAAPGTIKLLVTHHPLVPLPGERGTIDAALRGAGRALDAVRTAGVHLIMAGHNHAASAEIGGPRLSVDPQLLVVQAGSATSWRRRGTPNSFNLLTIEPGRLAVDQRDAIDGRFVTSRMLSFALAPDGWRAA
jgi:3',5'-cyclic AMP phosphodiesterase CpdA